MKKLSKIILPLLIIAFFYLGCKKQDQYLTAQVYTTFIKKHNYNEPNIMYWYIVEHPSGKISYAQNSIAYINWSMVVWSSSDKFPSFLYQDNAKHVGSVKIPVSVIPKI